MPRLSEPTFVGVEPFRPENLPCDEQLQDLVMIELDGIGDGDADRCISAAIGNTAFTFINRYSARHVSLDQVIDEHQGNCFAFAGLSTFVGRAVTGAHITPVIRTDCIVSEARLPAKTFHAFTVSKHPAAVSPLTIDRVSYTQKPCIIPIAQPSDAIYGSIVFGADKSVELHEDGGVVQVRVAPDNSRVTLLDAATTQKHDRPEDGVYLTETAFYGERGLESFMAVYEMFLGLVEKRKPDGFPGQLIPRL